MIEGVEITRKLNEKAIEFTYKGIGFGMSLDAFEKLTKKDLDHNVNEARKESESFKEAMGKYKEKYASMTSEQKKEHKRADDILFERWNEYEDDNNE